VGFKRIREGRHLTQQQVADQTRKPRGNGFYSQGLLSRIEAGYANAPLYTYVGITVDEAIALLARR
jgi:transcriptional regulator with XRE-family HTH domain